MYLNSKGTPILSDQGTQPEQDNPDLWSCFPNACLFLPEVKEVMHSRSTAASRARKNLRHASKFSRRAAVENPATPTNAERAAVLSAKGTKPSVDIPVVRSEILKGLGSPVVDGQEKNVETKAPYVSPVTPSTMQLHSGIRRPTEDHTLLEVNPSIVAETKKLFQISDEDGIVTRPRIKLDINKSSKDKLVLSQVPKKYSRAHLNVMLRDFGEIEEIDWKEPYGSEVHVMFKDPKVARIACERLDKSVVPGGTTLRARLRSSSPAAQLFVGDLMPSVSESMLEDAFEKIVQSKVQVTLKRDPNTRSPIGYGFAYFESDAAANKALVRANRMKVGEARIRVGRAERNCYLYVTDLAPTVTYENLTTKFSKYGDLVEEDTTIVRRTIATVKFDDERQAIMAKEILDEASIKKHLTVSYDNCKPLIAVMFGSDVTKEPNSLMDLLTTTFSKYGECAVEIPIKRDGTWRNLALVKFKGESSSAMQAAVEALQNVEHVSQVPVYCDWAREVFTQPPKNSVEVRKETNKPLRSYKEAAAKALKEAAKENGVDASDALANTDGGNCQMTVDNSARKQKTPLKASARAFFPKTTSNSSVPRLNPDFQAASSNSNGVESANFAGNVTPQPQKKMPFATGQAGPSESTGEAVSPTPPEGYVRIMVPRNVLDGMCAHGTVPRNWIVSPPHPAPIPNASLPARNH